MMKFLELREKLRSIYQKFQLYINPFMKFIVALIVFQLINKAIGYDERLLKVPVVLALSLLCAFTPSAILVLLAGVVSIAHIYSVSQIYSIIIILIALIIYCLFLRFTPRLGYVLLAVPILYLLKVPYLVPIVMGLFATPIAIIPTGCGVFIYYLFQIIKNTEDSQVKLSIEDTLSLYTNVINGLIKNKQMILTIVIFSLIILVTYFVRRMKFDYAREISIAAGSITCILGFLICDLQLDISEQIGSMILGTIASGLIAVVIQLFYLTLDYTAVEFVQFEDEDYYYYVKAVPKINVTAPEKNVKKFNTQKNAGLLAKMSMNDLSDDDQDYEEEYEEYENYSKRDKDNIR